MRRVIVRSGLRFIATGIALILVAIFFSAQVSDLLFLGMADDARLTFLGFFVGGMCAGWGILVAVLGFVQRDVGERKVKLAPAFLLLVSLVVLFFVLVYNSFTAPPAAAPLQQGETITI
ncbi:hypothetical protein L4X63_10665 [Geomonas sp. Red32]|uniref:hypothetical protein n=1 Tax=Geomonas sp. Red32 TaxID=2912856 RepID=UPI00202CBD1F|nr:hypothetical protein [Geomonas sp. Red32]MCM0082051.1 hypothetical protein [Geomonas sp. Red32]